MGQGVKVKLGKTEYWDMCMCYMWIALGHLWKWWISDHKEDQNLAQRPGEGRYTRTTTE